MRPSDLIPWRHFTIETSWSPEVADIELRKRIDGLLGTGDEVFRGRSTRNGQYKFQRVISYRNSFLPVITATVEPSHHNGARVRIRMRLHALVAIFMQLWMTGAMAGAIVGILALGSGQPAGLIALALPVFGAGLTTIPFALEARAAERLLREVYAAAPALPAPPETGAAYR